VGLVKLAMEEAEVLTSEGGGLADAAVGFNVAAGIEFRRVSGHGGVSLWLNGKGPHVGAALLSIYLYKLIVRD
jgi:hypothetical protein